MANFIGATVNIGLGKEGTRGTAVVPAVWVPKSSFDFNDQAEYVRQEAPYGVIEQNMDADVSKLMGQGALEIPVFSESIGYILGAAFGAFPTPSSGAAGTYLHDFTVAQTSQHQSLTIHRKDGNEHVRYALAMLDSVEFTYSLDDYLMCNATFMSKQGTTTSGTASYTEEAKFRPQDVTMTIADTIAGLSGGTEVKVEEFTLTIEKNLEEYQVHGSVDLNDIFNNRFAYSGSMTILWNSTDYKGWFKDGTKKAFEIDAVNTSETVGSGSENPQLRFQMSPSVIEEWSMEEDNDGVVKQTIGFTGLYDLANEQSLLCRLKNETASY